MKALDLTDMRFGSLIAVGRSENQRKGNSVVWNCLCDCGKTCTAPTNQLNVGNKLSCGCKKSKDLTGLTFRYLFVCSRISKIGCRTKYRCRCICGKVVIVDGAKLPSRISCGCKRRKPKPRLSIKQVVTNYLYGSYKANAARKNTPFRLSKKRFEAFIFANCSYCGDSPKTPFTKWRANEKCLFNGIDRVDNSKGYSHKNCVSCCKECNYKKGNQNVDGFLRWIKKVYINRDLICQ